jgi:hypothetical protein
MKLTISRHPISVWREMGRRGIVRVHAALIVKIVVDVIVVAVVEDAEVVAAVTLSSLHEKLRIKGE